MAENPCCLCLSQDKIVKSMFADEESDIADKINALTGVKFDKFDKMPNGVCIDCLVKLEDAYKLRLMILNSYESLRFMYKSHNPDESLPPPIEMPLEVHLTVTPEPLHFSNEADHGLQTKEHQIETMIKLSRLLPPTIISAPDANNPFPCQICGHWLGNKKAVVTHVIREHTDTRKVGRSRRKGNETIRPPVPKLVTFDCEVCGKPFQSKSQVVTHVLQDHTATKKYQQRGSWKYHTCLRCDRKFTSRDLLLQHARDCGVVNVDTSSSDSEAS